MKAVLDHIGIAIRDLPAALAFYRDALGLDVQAPEMVASEQVRAHFAAVGEATLELLEATGEGSAVARFIEKRGPGIHHITLRVEDLTAALGQLKARGVRLVDDQPRPGAAGSLVAFIHPASAQGVLIELKQGLPAEAGSHKETHTWGISRYSVGDLELISLHDGFFRLDGGAMFGVIPKPFWTAKAPADERNRITLAMRPLLVRGVRTMLIDAGLGDKENEKFHDIYGVERERHLDDALAAAGVAPDEIDIVLATHLHFNHAGGFTSRDGLGRVRPRFPRARYVVRRGEWEDASHPHERNRASYRPENFLPLANGGVLEMVDADQTIMPGVTVRRTAGHTQHHQSVWIQSGGARAVYPADLMPTQAHLALPWIMGYDLYPMETLATKKQFVSDVLDQDVLVLFAHDPDVAAGHIRTQAGEPTLEPAS